MQGIPIYRRQQLTRQVLATVSDPPDNRFCFRFACSLSTSTESLYIYGCSFRRSFVIAGLEQTTSTESFSRCALQRDSRDSNFAASLSLSRDTIAGLQQQLFVCAASWSCEMRFAYGLVCDRSSLWFYVDTTARIKERVDIVIIFWLD